MSLPLLVAVMVAATAAGAVALRRAGAPVERGTQEVMGLLLTWVLPPVYLVLVSRIHLDLRLVGGLLTGVVAILTAGTLAWLLADRVFRLPRRTVGAVILATIVSNTGYYGLPLARTVLGADELGPAVAWDTVIASPTLVLGAFAVGAAFGTPDGADDVRGRIRAFVRNPLLWAAVVGFAVPWDAPAWAGDAAQAVVVAILPVGFFVVGVQLAAQLRDDDDRGRPLPPGVGIVVACRLAVAPGVVLAASALWLDLPSGLLLQAAAPSGLNGMLVAHRFGLDPRLVAASIVVTTSLMTLGVVVGELVV